MKYPVAMAAALTFALAACGEEPAPATGEDGREATGEVLEGTISDAMLPIDEVRSQAPLADAEAGEGDGASSDSADSTDGQDDTVSE